MNSTHVVKRLRDGDFDAVAAYVADIRGRKGFLTPHHFGDGPYAVISFTEGMVFKVGRIGSEISEAMAAMAAGEQVEFERELADIVIRALDILGTAHQPVEINKGKPSKDRHRFGSVHVWRAMGEVARWHAHLDRMAATGNAAEFLNGLKMLIESVYAVANMLRINLDITISITLEAWERRPPYNGKKSRL